MRDAADLRGGEKRVSQPWKINEGKKRKESRDEQGRPRQTRENPPQRIKGGRPGKIRFDRGRLEKKKGMESREPR